MKLLFCFLHIDNLSISMWEYCSVVFTPVGDGPVECDVVPHLAEDPFGFLAVLCCEVSVVVLLVGVTNIWSVLRWGSPIYGGTVGLYGETTTVPHTYIIFINVLSCTVSKCCA
jgi:hypothetical protein